jgi:hypothetical protein
MKKFLLLFLFILLIFSVEESAAVTYLYFWINGDTAHVLTQGDQLAWDLDVQTPGSTVITELYLDLDVSRSITGADLLLQAFDVTDGEVKEGEPSDSSTTPDGKIYLMFGPFGFAAQNYLLRVVDTDESSVTSWFEINAMASPAAQITGNVIVEGTSAPDNLYEYVMINAFGQGMFSGLTDNQGNYTINLPAADSTWRIEALFYPRLTGYILSTETYEIQVPAAGVNDIDFSFALPSSWIYGNILDQAGAQVLMNGWISCRNTTTEQESEGQLQDGHYNLPLTIIPQGQDSTNYFRLDLNGDMFIPNYLAPQTYEDIFPVSSGDSIQKNIVVYATNSIIYVYVTEDAGAPSKSYQISAGSEIGYTRSMSDAGNGYGELHVHSGSSYWVGIDTDSAWGTPLPEGYIISGGDWKPALAGETVYLNLVPEQTGLEVENSVPQQMYLKQNYPNPFNPSTQIEYGLTKAGYVKLTVYNLLGQEMTVLVNSPQSAGVHRITWQPDQMAAGVYLYRLETEKMQFTKKLVLMK